MKERHWLSHAVAVAAVSFVAVVTSAGCNAILGNEEGKLRASVSTDAGDAASAVDGGGGTVSDGGGLGSVECDTTQGNKECFGLCVKINDPNTGCGGASCDGCDPKNVNGPACRGAGGTLACGYDTCKPGFENCNGNIADGCETSLGSKATCGGCSNDCGSKLCAFEGGVFQCVDSCSNGTKECSGACVDTKSSVDNCGDCGVKCERLLATASCAEGNCVYQCKPGTHDCGGACKLNIDPDSCGTSCTPCPDGGENTVRVCANGQCGVRCEAGTLDCDRDPKNGCEVKGDSCPSTADCGFLGCINGNCCYGRCIPYGTKCLPPAPSSDG